ncbi:hypothetical protein BKA81DRAFT_97829 [Phyllosticta paracitricarpa]|uniref:Secreted protein n=1 Tax=Phyllosticta citricarpa TaxID=55181 RepID=A0ABR1LYX0_9PEZI
MMMMKVIYLGMTTGSVLPSYLHQLRTWLLWTALLCLTQPKRIGPSVRLSTHLSICRCPNTKRRRSCCCRLRNPEWMDGWMDGEDSKQLSENHPTPLQVYPSVRPSVHAESQSKPEKYSTCVWTLMRWKDA